MHGRRVTAVIGLLAVVYGVAACGGGADSSGLAEPLIVRNAMFFTGSLPGTPAPDDAEVTTDASTDGNLEVTAVQSVSAILAPRELGAVFTGRTSTDAYSVAMRFVDLGTGYWVVPVGGPDPTAGGELTWQMTVDMGDPIPSGLHQLGFVAIGAAGQAGTQNDLQVCVVPPVPDNLNACDDTIAPPAYVISLSWDTEVDLDLVVDTPTGTEVGWQHPTTAQDGGVVGPTVGTLDRNSNANCVTDGVRREDLVFQQAPSPGIYHVYADLFSACGQGSVIFHVSVYQGVTSNGGMTWQFVETQNVAGQLLAIEADEGTTQGTFVTDVELP